MLRWLQYLYLHLPEQVQRQQFSVFAIFFGTILFNLLVFLLLIEPFAFHHAFWLTMAGVVLTGVAFWHWQWSMRLTTHLLLAQSGLLIYYAVWVTGGLFSSTMIWLMVLPVPAVFLLGWRDSLVWIGLVIVSVLSLIPLTEKGWLPVSYVYGHQHLLWSLGNYTFTAISLLIGLLIYQRIYLKQLDEINARNQELSEARAALLNAESYKDQFLASVGHELRTPMNAILGFNEVIHNELANDPQGLRTVALVRESTDHLLKLVNQILDFSQIQAGRMPLQLKPTRLRDAFEQCMLNFTRAPDSPVQFRARLNPQLPEWVSTDSARLKDVLCHLIDNAFKFTPSGLVQLNIQRENQQLLFEVKDTGVGIAPELQAFIFNRFEHADQETQRQFGGAGLGLAICKGLVDLFGGDIGMHSERGKGSTFWFRIPLLPCDPPPLPDTAPGVPDPGISNRSWRLLLVDDNPVNLQVATFLCQQLWPLSQVQSVNSGQACISSLQTRSVDIVLMDLIMPDMDGLQTTRAIRAFESAQQRDVVIIGLTASSHHQDHAACLEAGMNDVLVKPLNKAHLQTCVELWLAKKEVLHG